VNLLNLLKKLYHFFEGKVRNILELKDTQHAVAGGVAVGIFFGFTPLFGLKTLISIGVAWLFGFNILAAVIAVTLHDILTPVWPIVLRMEYQIGYWILSHPHHFPPPLRVRHIGGTAQYLHLQWTTFFGVGFPLLLGSLFFAIPSAVVSYAVTLGILNARKKLAEKSDPQDIKQD